MYFRAFISFAIPAAIMLFSALAFPPAPAPVLPPAPELPKFAGKPEPAPAKPAPVAPGPAPAAEKTPVTEKAPALHFTEDPAFAKEYDRKKGSRDAKYAHDRTKPSFRRDWTRFSGGVYLDSGKVSAVVRAVLKRMPHVPKDEAIVTLLTETAVAETMSGFYTSAHGDHGIFQIREEAAKDLLAWLKVRRKDAWNAVMMFRDEKRALGEDLDLNIPFGAAVAISEYWRKAGPSFHEQISDMRDRAIMWKSVYNTKLGKGTVIAYERRNADWKRISAGGVGALNKKAREAGKTGGKMIAER